MGKKCTFLWDLNHPSRVPLSQNLDLQAVLTQGNLVISCSSAFYPPTFCLVGMLFLLLFLGCFFLANRKIRAYPWIFCQLPIQLLFVQGSCEPDRGLDIGTLCPAQSPRPCPDQAPGEVKEEMPSNASQLALCWFNPPAIWSPLPAMHTAWAGKWKLSAEFSIFPPLFCKPGCMERVETTGWCVILCCCPHIETGAQNIKDSTWQGSSRVCVCILKTMAIQAYGDC